MSSIHSILFINNKMNHNNNFDLSILSLEQRYAFHEFTKGKNLFITGPGGTGKTKLIQYLVKHCERIDRPHQVCALTGCAAVLLKCKARTLHAWSGIKLARGSPEKVVANVLNNPGSMKSWKSIQTLIVDEISMLSCRLFEILEKVARFTRKNTLPFGGIQVVFLGDFFQLPPVGSSDDPESSMFCFESPIWKNVFPHKNQIELTTVFRQNDPLYVSILSEIRKGEISEENKNILQKYVKRQYCPEEHNGCIPPKLFAIKKRVDYINEETFSQINEPVFEFPFHFQTNQTSYIDTGKPISSEILSYCQHLSSTEIQKEIDSLSNAMPCSKSLSLKKGSIVMCTYNIDVEIGICNGSQGIVIDIIKTSETSDPIPLVKFSNGKVIPMTRTVWQSEDYPTITVSQIPLCLAWAMTIHKIQGSTLTMAEIDIGRTVFEYGQVYVALSRVQSLDGLYLIHFIPEKIKANPIVVEFYRQIIPFDPKIMEKEEYRYLLETSNFSKPNRLHNKPNTIRPTEELTEENYEAPPSSKTDESTRTISLTPTTIFESSSKPLVNFDQYAYRPYEKEPPIRCIKKSG